MKTLHELINSDAQAGHLNGIMLRPQRRGQVRQVQSVQIKQDGLVGDHYGGRGKRAVTLIQGEHLSAIAACLGQKQILAEDTRRNLIVTGINLLSLKDATFSIGCVAVLEGTGICAPYSRMEETFGKGGYNAMRGHGGITARVLRTGTIATGDVLSRL